MSKIKSMFKDWRIISLLILLILSVWAINPQPWRDGAAIRSVEKDSPASLAGISNPLPSAPLMSREVIESLNNQPIKNSEEYYNYISQLKPNTTLQIKTNKDTYKMKIQEEILRVKTGNIINETIFDNETNTSKTVQRPEYNETRTGNSWIGLKVYDAPTNNIRKGLDLEGGTSVILQPEEKVSEETLQLAIENLKERLNIYGLSDTSVREASDLEGNKFIKVEIAGATEEEVTQLIGSQGKFESKISNEVIFSGGEDIKFVCRSPDCSGPDPRAPCGKSGDGYACQYYFQITISNAAAKRQAEATKNLPVVAGSSGGYLNESIDLYLDDELVESLKIGSDLKGKEATDIIITLGGSGRTRQEAALEASKEMKRIQTIVQTGSLPVKLKVVQVDQISPLLGKDFLNNAVILALIAIIAVSIVVFISYRKLTVSVPIMFTMLAEVVLLLGVAAIVPGWTIDLAAIAGIIIVVGTGVDAQIVIADEMIRGEKQKLMGIKDMIKAAFFIILSSYMTNVVALLPLFFAGAGLLKGFAITTIMGLTFGSFITRPAYSKILETFMK